MKEIQILNNGDTLNAIRTKINENFELMEQGVGADPLTKFGVNEGNETNGVADLLDINEGTLNFKVGGEYPNLVVIAGDGTTTKIESVNPLYLENLADGEYTVVVNGSNSNITDATFYSQLLEPENAEQGDVWFNGQNAYERKNTTATATQLENTGLNLQNLAKLDDLYVATGNGNNLYVSVDGGNSWQTKAVTTFSGGTIIGCAAFKDKIFIVTANRRAYSIDKTLDFTLVSTISQSESVFPTMVRVENDTIFINVGSNYLLYSTDGIEWLSTSTIQGSVIKDITFANGKYYVVDTSGYIFETQNLDNWSRIQLAVTNPSCIKGYKDNLIIGFITGTIVIYNLTNNTTRQLEPIKQNATVTDINILPDEAVLIVGHYGLCAISYDLTNFTQLLTTDNGLTASEGFFVVGSNGVHYRLDLQGNWVNYPYIPIGEVIINGGEVTYFTTYPYNSNGLFDATSSSYGLLRTAAEPDELNCQCSDAVLTPANLYNLQNFRLGGTEYNVDDKVACPYHHNLQLVCTQAGTTENAALNTKGLLEAGAIIEDGTVIWQVEELGVAGGGGSGKGASLPIGFIGQTTVPIDESLGLQRYANGSQMTITDNTEEFVATIEKWAQFYPSMVASSQEEWNSIRTLSAFGQCGKYFIDRENGYIQLPLVINAQGLGDLTNFSNIKPQTLPNVEGYLNEILTSSATNITSGALTRTITMTGGNDGGGYARNVADLGFDASKSSSVYQDGAPVQQEAVMYPYFIQIASGATTTIDITNEIELNNPFFLGKSEYFEIQPDNLSWKKGGTTVTFAEYPTFYEKVVKAYNGTETVEGMSVKSIDEVYTDFDYVLDLANEQFRLPLLNGSECVPSDKKVEMELLPNNNKYVAPANGWFAVQKNSGVTNGYIYIWDEDNNLVNEWVSTSSNYMSKVELYVPKGHTVRVGYNLTGSLTFFGFIYAKGNGTLYYYVGETAQNANLINVPRIIENKADINASNFTDKGKIALTHLPMPSAKNKTLTLGSSGTEYTAPADGWFCWRITASTLSLYSLTNITKGYAMGNVANGAGFITQLLLPVNKNDIVQTTYQSAPSTHSLIFYYANGTESEAN